MTAITKRRVNQNEKHGSAKGQGLIDQTPRYSLVRFSLRAWGYLHPQFLISQFLVPVDLRGLGRPILFRQSNEMPKKCIPRIKSPACQSSNLFINSTVMVLWRNPFTQFIFGCLPHETPTFKLASLRIAETNYVMLETSKMKIRFSKIKILHAHLVSSHYPLESSPSSNKKRAPLISFAKWAWIGVSKSSRKG